MIGLGSNRLTVCRRGGMSVTQAGRGGMEWLAGGRVPSWASPYSAQATQALKAQFPTQWPTIRDYGFAHPEIVPYADAVPLVFGNFFADAELIPVKDAGLMTFRTLEDGSIFLRIMHHHIKNATQLFTKTSAHYNVDSELFSLLKRIGDYQLNSKYEFYAEQWNNEGDATPIKPRWSQTSNPYTSTTCTGYTNISNSIRGLRFYSTTSNTLITDTTPWWGACGCWTAYQGGIPGLNATVAKGTLDLWIRVA